MNKKNFFRNVKSFLGTFFFMLFISYPLIGYDQMYGKTPASLLEIIGTNLVCSILVFILVVKAFHHYDDQTNP